MNVGGRHFTTALSTLRSEPDSQLAAMFSGKQEVARDQDGRYFIDADSYAFGTILDFLRSGEIIMGGMSLESYKLAEKLGIKSFV